MNRKFENDPKMIESQINLARARINQTVRAPYLNGPDKLQQIEKFEEEIVQFEKKLETINSVN